MQPNIVDGASPGWLPLLTAITNIGFSIIVAWYLLAKAIPRLQDRFSEDLRIQRLDFEKAIEREKKSLDRVLELVAANNIELLRRTSEKLDLLVAFIKELHVELRRSRSPRVNERERERERD
jgi:hypothetical protein